MAESTETDAIVSEENDTNTETESEDGGVALSPFAFSDKMEIAHDSAPTSVSQSPKQSAAPYETASGSIMSSVAEGSTLAGPPPHLPPAQVIGNSTALPPFSSFNISDDPIPNDFSMPLMPANTMSFAEALSGELLSVPQGSGYSSDEDDVGSSDETSGMPQGYPTAYAIQTQSSAMQGYPSAGAATNGQLQTTNSQEANANVQILPDLHSLPSLSDVFGSGFLPQPYESAQYLPVFTGIDFMGEDTGEDTGEDMGEVWDDVDSVKNMPCWAFFNHWKQMYAYETPDYPRISGLANDTQKVQRPKRILAEDLDPEDPKKCDMQGIHWSRFQVTKEDAREVRRMTYKSHVNVTPYCSRLITNRGAFGTPGFKVSFSEESLPSSDEWFTFRDTNTRFKSYISHFQLRHNICASSKNALFYNGRPKRNYGYGTYIDTNLGCDAKIMCFNTDTSDDECVMDFRKVIDKDAPRLLRPSTLNAEAGVLVVGSYEGVYAMKSLSAIFESKPTTGTIANNDDNGSTNHIQNFLDRRSGLPQAAFSSNDMTIRILDCTTETFVRTHHFPYQVNCSATSPDGRLRLLVGDDCEPIVSDAEKGGILAKLPNHTNFGFACAWAPDGITMATGAQDGFVQVWDARNMSDSLQSIPMEMAGSRTLQFSPLGSGKRVLIIAEPADFVHVVDAHTFESKQTIEFFGEIAGISMPPDGSRLYIANQDETYGGLMEFERSWGGGWRRPKRRGDGELLDLDWLPDEDLDDDPRVVLSAPQRGGMGMLPRRMM